MIAAIVAECNPPHSGHAYLISRIREEFGTDTCVLLLLSGNYVQRGDLAFTDRYSRAAGAVAIGADLVLELPFPYSCQTAEIYATSSVSILNRLGTVNRLCFGSESGDLHELSAITDYLSSDAYATDLETARAADKRKSLAQIRTDLIREKVSADAADAINLPNNILAIEYIMALKRTGSMIAPYTIKRRGSYHGNDSVASGYMSAGAIRQEIKNGKIDQTEPYLSAEFRKILKNDIESGLSPADFNRLSPILLPQLRRSAPCGNLSSYFDIDEGLAAKMKYALDRATDIPSFMSLLKAKHMTDAHLRRALLNAYFGVTSSDVHTAPPFTRLLAANARGKESLKYLKQHSSLPILSRPSDIRRLTDEKVRQAVELADFADSLYFLSVPSPQPVANLYRFRPIITE